MSKNIKIFLNYFLGPLLFVLLTFSLYKQIARQPDLSLHWLQIKSTWRQPAFWLVLLLMFANWGMEARKWQLLIRPLERLTFIIAFKSVFAGCSITMLTPNRIGEYGGRVMYVQEENRLKSISLTILGSMSQLFITILMGTTGLILFKYYYPDNRIMYQLIPELAGDILLYTCIAISIILILLYLRVGLLIRSITSIKSLNNFAKYWSLLSSFSRKQLLRIMFLSFLRYMVFILQYILLLKLMQVNIALGTCFWVLTIFYLVMTLAPTIGFTELPIRAAASVTLLQLFSNNILGIQAASLGIWLINLVLPALIGSILIFGIKITKERNEYN